MQRTLEGKIAIVTGSGRGIGRAIALKLARHGAKLVINDLDQEPAERVAQEIRDQGGQAIVCFGNVSAPDFGERLIAQTMDAYQGLDIIVNNAGYTWDNVIQKMSDEQWYAILDAHLTAPFRILRAAQPVIRALSKAEAARGERVVRKIVNVSSTSGLFGNAGQLNYAAGKAGIIGMTKTLCKEWGRMNVTVNCVAYAWIKTRLTGAAGQGTEVIDGREIKVGINPDFLASMEKSIPLGHGGSPEEAAGAAYLFCIPESDYVSGQTLLCSGGLTGT